MNDTTPERRADPTVISEIQPGWGKIGHFLIQLGKIHPTDAVNIVRQQRRSGQRFGEAAVQLGLIKPEDLQYALAKQFDYPYLLRGEGDFSPDLVAAYEPYSDEVESFRALRNQLLLRWFQMGHKALSFTSVTEKEGVSYQTANLAVVFSQLGERTLVIDANLRRPRQQQIFNLRNRAGLSETLAGHPTNSICKISGLGELYVLPAGAIPPNPAELLARNTFGHLLAELSESYDIMLIDAPALSGYPDAQNISAMAGGAVFVVRQNHARLAHLEVAKTLIRATGTPLVGAVLSNF